MLNKNIEAALNRQVNAELWSAYLYLAMSCDFASKGLPGFANWMKIQFQEEQDHALKFANFIVSRGGKVDLTPIDAVRNDWPTTLEAFEATLGHEQKVTAMINDIYATAVQEKDYATESMLRWFIDEQVEEEETAQGIIDALRMIKDNGFGLYQLDKELATRTYTPLTTA